MKVSSIFLPIYILHTLPGHFFTQAQPLIQGVFEVEPPYQRGMAICCIMVRRLTHPV